MLGYRWFFKLSENRIWSQPDSECYGTLWSLIGLHGTTMPFRTVPLTSLALTLHFEAWVKVPGLQDWLWKNIAKLISQGGDVQGLRVSKQPWVVRKVSFLACGATVRDVHSRLQFHLSVIHQYLFFCSITPCSPAKRYPNILLKHPELNLQILISILATLSNYCNFYFFSCYLTFQGLTGQCVTSSSPM